MARTQRIALIPHHEIEPDPITKSGHSAGRVILMVGDPALLQGSWPHGGIANAAHLLYNAERMRRLYDVYERSF